MSHLPSHSPASAPTTRLTPFALYVRGSHDSTTTHSRLKRRIHEVQRVVRRRVESFTWFVSMSSRPAASLPATPALNAPHVPPGLSSLSFAYYLVSTRSPYHPVTYPPHAASPPPAPLPPPSPAKKPPLSSPGNGVNGPYGGCGCVFRLLAQRALPTLLIPPTPPPSILTCSS